MSEHDHDLNGLLFEVHQTHEAIYAMREHILRMERLIEDLTRKLDSLANEQNRAKFQLTHNASTLDC